MKIINLDKLKYFWKGKNFWLFVVVFILSIFIRSPDMGRESINPDAVNWHYRCQQFANGIKYFQFEKTYPHYHPGVSLCWIMFFPTEIYKQLSNETYNSNTFLSFNYWNTLVLVVVISFLIAYSSVLISGYSGIIFAFLLNVEPFFYGNSRLIHLDTLTALFLFLGIFHLVRYLQNSSQKYFYASSFLFGLAFLTKSVSVVFFIIALFWVWYFSRKRKVIKSLTFFICALLTSVILFPALWNNPIEITLRIFSEAERIGIRNPHNQFFMGISYSEDEKVGNIFYFWTMLIKFSPLIIFGLIFIVFDLGRRLYNFVKVKIGNKIEFRSAWVAVLQFIDSNKQVVIWSSFYVVYILILLYSSKKVDRYLLILVPPIIYYLSLIRINYLKNNIILLGVVNLMSIIYFMPYLFLYYSPIFLKYENVNSIVGQKSFGQGIVNLRDKIVSDYGNPDIGFYDVKPMETIYPNSKVFDIRNTGPSKVDLVVLSINEKLPKDYQEKFKLYEKFYLIDIPLYEIYIKN
jgi:hypothetical protein